MKIIPALMLVLSVVAGLTATANAKNGRVAGMQSGTQTTWYPADPSSSIH
jgi:hypothetical protein